MGEGCSKPKFSMFCALSQNFQHFFEKLYIYLEAKCLKNSIMTLIEILVGPEDFEFLIKTLAKYGLHQLVQNHLVYTINAPVAVLYTEILWLLFLYSFTIKPNYLSLLKITGKYDTHMM